MTAVPVPDGPDIGAPWHYGDPGREQRMLESDHGAVDLGHHGVLTITGPDRLDWLHNLTSQHLVSLAPGVGTTAYLLAPQGHLEHVLYGVDDGETFWAHTEPGRVADLVGWLDRMRFMSRVEVADRTADIAIVWAPGELSWSGASEVPVRRGRDALGGAEWFVGRADLDAALGAERAGEWAYEALRIAAGMPRLGLDTDERTIPNEIATPDGDLLGAGVHLAKGCYRGQETVGRVHTLGRPPRRLTLLHLDGSEDTLPPVGADLTLDGRVVGRIGSSARHHELGPIALGLVRRATPTDADLLVAGIAAGQQVLVDPEVGLHVRPQLGRR